MRFNRAIINPKWEHYYSHDGMQRLHLLYGESNQNEFAYALKVGTTSLVLRAIEERRVPEDLALAAPLTALREVSRDPSFAWEVTLTDGSRVKATDLQRRYLELAEEFRGTDEQTDWTLDAWAEILDGLDRDPLALEDRLDWVAKYKIVETYRAEEGLSWEDDALHSIDLEYHNIDPDKSLFYAWQDMGNARRIVDEIDIVEAMTEPPANTRARGRAERVRELLGKRVPRFYFFDWNGCALDRNSYIEMPDPFETYSDWK